MINKEKAANVSVMYPDIKIMEHTSIKDLTTEHLLFLITNIRKQYNGVWYFKGYLDKYIFNEDYEINKAKALDTLHHKVYKILISETDLNEDENGRIYSLHLDQRSEIERLNNK